MIEQYAHSLAHLLQTHPHMGGLITFLIAFLESLAVIGTIVPGSVTMTAIGVLIGTGVLPVSLTLFWATLGAFVGDLLGYGIGKYYQDRLRNMWPFNKRPQLLTAGELFFHKHGGKSILIGRFIGPLRSLIPMIAGILQMPLQKFIIAAIPSAALWALVYMLPGILIGAVSLQLPPAVATKFILILLAIIVLISVFAWLIKIIILKWRQKFDRFEQGIWSYLQTSPKVRPFYLAIVNKDNPEDYHQLTWVILGALFGFLSITVWWVTFAKGSLTLLNRPFFEFLRSIRHLSVDRVFVGITLLGDGQVLMISGALIFFWLLYKRYVRTALHWLIALLLGVSIPNFFKYIFYWPRPSGLLHASTSSSFPSGHTFFAMMFFGFLATLINTHIPPRFRRYPYYLAFGITFLVGLSRLYLGAHWLTDVLASLCFGLFLICFLTLSYRRKLEPINVKSFIVMVIFTPLIIWALFFSFNYQKNMLRYTLLWPSKTIEETQWWGRLNQALPSYRENRFGRPEEPMNLQYAGDIQQLRGILIQQGWKENPDLTLLKSTLQKLAQPQNHYSTLFPTLYLNHPPELFIVKNLPNAKLVLKLWDSNVYLSQTWNVIYVGSLVQYQIDTDKKLITYSFNDVKELLPYLKYRYWHVTSIETEVLSSRLLKKNWQGEILQIRAPTFY